MLTVLRPMVTCRTCTATSVNSVLNILYMVLSCLDPQLNQLISIDFHTQSQTIFQIPPFNLDSLLLGIRAHNEVLVAGTVPATPRPAHTQLELAGLQLLKVFCDPCEGLYGTLAYFPKPLMIYLEHAVDSHVPAF